MTKNLKTTVIHGYYKSDQSNGIAITVKFMNPDVKRDFDMTYAAYEQYWMHADKNERISWVADCFEQLNQFLHTNPEARNFGEGCVALINILFLEKYGYITSDNFNGCIVVYES